MKIFKTISKSFCRSYTNQKGGFIDCINWEYYMNSSNLSAIASNILSRNVSCNMRDLLQKLELLSNAKHDSEETEMLKQALAPHLYVLPNSTHPHIAENKSGEPIMLEKIGIKPPFTYFPATFASLTKRLNLLRTKHLGHVTGHKSYYLKNDLASLEHSLVTFTIAKLLGKKFRLMTVPDIVSKNAIEGCGMRTDGMHSQIYHVDENWGNDLCLSGTAEMALASYMSSKRFDHTKLPLKVCSVSRCYRAEANKHQKEKGIFRVHQFTKVEMFGVTSNENGTESEDLLQEFTSIQKEIFQELGLHFKVMEMPPLDLGFPAYHKIDIESWIPSQKLYGEISSASNCTDYQSRRLNIKYTSADGNEKFCHTVNGTACAIPRLLISILENFQNLDGSVNVPDPLKAYMKKDVIKEKFNEIMLSTKPAS